MRGITIADVCGDSLNRAADPLVCGIEHRYPGQARQFNEVAVLGEARLLPKTTASSGFQGFLIAEACPL